MATPSSTLAWRIPWREEPGGLPSMGSHRVGHDQAVSLHFTSPSFIIYNTGLSPPSPDSGHKSWEKLYLNSKNVPGIQRKALGLLCEWTSVHNVPTECFHLVWINLESISGCHDSLV